MVGWGDKLALVYHSGNPFAGSQRMTCLVMDLRYKKKLSEGLLPLTPRKKLRWLGFADVGMLVSMDSAGVVRGTTEHIDIYIIM